MPAQDLLRVFARRLNKDGTADSICLFCFATVASRPQEQELEEPEGDHFCWQRQDSSALMKPLLVGQGRRTRNESRFGPAVVNHAKSARL
jgi:hypothetical protein